MKMPIPSYTRLFVLLLAVSLPAVTGCAPLYVPNTVHSPMLEEQGEVQVGGYLGSSGIDLQGAVAVSDHIGAAAGFSYADQDRDAEEEVDDPDLHRHRFGEMSLGYFTEVGQYGRVELYCGYGRGWAEARDDYEFFSSETITLRGRYDRLFLQPAVGVQAGPLHLYGAVRLARVNFYEFEEDGQIASENKRELFAEPALGAGLGTSGLRFDFQAGNSMALQGPGSTDIEHESFWLSIGVQLRTSAW